MLSLNSWKLSGVICSGKPSAARTTSSLVFWKKRLAVVMAPGSSLLKAAWGNVSFRSQGQDILFSADGRWPFGVFEDQDLPIAVTG